MCIGGKEWKLDARCVYCDTALTPVNGCVPSTTLSVAVVRCDPCGREYEMTVRLQERRRTTRVHKKAAA